MKTSANFDENALVMTKSTTAGQAAPEGIFSEGFFSRVYRTTLMVFAVAALLVGSHLGAPGFLGLAYGTTISLASVWAIEWTVRGLVRPGARVKPVQLILFLNLKLPLLTVALAGAAWAATTGRINVFALVGGLALVHGVIILKAAGASLVAALPPVPARAAVGLASKTVRAAGSPVLRTYPAPRPEALPAPE